MANAPDHVAIGRIVKPFGVKGEVRVQSLTDVSDRFERLTRVTLVAPSGQTISAAVTGVRGGPDSYIVGLDAFSTPEEASVYRGAFVQIPQEESPALPEGWYYEYELAGMSVTDESGRELGVLEEVLETPGNHVFVVRRDGKEILIPATKEMVIAVDVKQRSMVVRVSEELLAANGDTAAM